MNHAKSFFHRHLAGLAIVAVALLSGCAASGPTKQARTYFDESHAEVSSKPVAVVADGCFLRSEIGTSHVLAQPSEQIGKVAVSRIERELKDRGHRVKAVHAPFICGSLPPDFFAEYEIAPVRGADRQRINSVPILLTPRDPAPEDAAMTALLAAVTKAEASIDNQEGTPLRPIKLALTDEEAALLKRATDAEYLWVSIASGVEVSAGRQIGVGMLTGLVTGVLTGGASLVASFPVDTTNQQVALVRLDTRELIWKKRIQIPGLLLTAPEPEKEHPFMRNLLSPYFPPPAAATK